MIRLTRNANEISKRAGWHVRTGSQALWSKIYPETSCTYLQGNTGKGCWAFGVLWHRKRSFAALTRSWFGWLTFRGKDFQWYRWQNQSINEVWKAILNGHNTVSLQPCWMFSAIFKAAATRKVLVEGLMSHRQLILQHWPELQLSKEALHSKLQKELVVQDWWSDTLRGRPVIL